MSVYIKGMEMPTRCFECPMCCVDTCGILCCVDSCCISHGSYIEYREVDVDTARNGRPDWCPLIPVSEHGRLIDADDFFRNFPELLPYEFAAPTIIPADHIGDVNEMVTDEEGE